MVKRILCVLMSCCFLATLSTVAFATDIDTEIESALSTTETVEPSETVEPTETIEPTIEYVYIEVEADDLSIMEKALEDYTPTEGYLFLIFSILLVTLIFKFISYVWLF